VAVILFPTTISGLTEEWFILLWLLYCCPLLFNVLQRSGSYCCGCYIDDHFCLIFDRGVVHIVVAGYIIDHYFLMFDRGVVRIAVAGYIVDH
jgi:hypothetical protein